MTRTCGQKRDHGGVATLMPRRLWTATVNTDVERGTVGFRDRKSLGAEEIWLQAGVAALLSP